MKTLLDSSFVDNDSAMITLMPLLLILLAVIQGIAILINSVAAKAVFTKAAPNLQELMPQQLLVLPAGFR